MSINLQILVEDTNFRNNDLKSEHGLSFYVKTPNQNFIFDCGYTGLAWENAKILRRDLTKINFAVISHAHYDHAGGFPKLLNHVKPKKIYTGVNFWKEKFSKTPEGYKYRGAGFSEKDLKNWGIAQKICKDFLQIDENIFLVGNFKKRYEFEKIPQKFVRGENKIPDNFDDEICLVLREDKKISVVAACSHIGILNIVSTVKEKFNLPILNLIGGIHLLDADYERIEKTLNELKNLGVMNCEFCHCSGEKIHSEILTTGSIFEI